MMNFLISIWAWLDGKKTNIGGALLFIAMFSQEVIINQWHVAILILPKIISTLNWIGGVLLPGGFAHKIAKATADTSTPS